MKSKNNSKPVRLSSEQAKMLEELKIKLDISENAVFKTAIVKLHKDLIG